MSAGTSVTVGVDVAATGTPPSPSPQRPPVAPPAQLASADAILEAIAGLKGSVDHLAAGLESHKEDTHVRFEGMAQTVDQLVAYVNGSLPPPGDPPSTDASGVAITVKKIEPLSVTVPRVAAVSEQARTDVAKLRETVDGMQAELLKQSSIMGIGKRGLAWAVSAEGRKQLAVLFVALYAAAHQMGLVK